MYKYIKRFFDLILATIIIIVIFPFFLIICILIFIKLGRPVFFKQERTGKGMRSFFIVKFRTMKPQDNSYKKDSDRLTKFGVILRKTSLDEIPQLINILKGEMTFIGPRPLIKDYNKYYYKAELKRFDVRPGMSGYAEAKGRHKISWRQQFEYDCFYVDNFSFFLDLKIIFETIPKVLNFSNVSSLNRSDGERLDIVRRND